MSWVACPVGGVCRLRARRHFLQHAASRRRRLAAAHRLCRQLLHEGAGLPHERSRGRFSLSAGLCSRQLYALRIQPARRHGACGQPGGRGIPAGRTLLPQPGVLYGNAATIGIAADDTLAVTLPMKQLTRRLTLKMKLAGGNPGILAGTEASITGIAPALDIAALKLQGDPATVRPVFVREGDVLTAELNLLGTAADVRQEFIIVLIATDGQRQTLARDMTGALSDFNRGTDPMTLDATLELMNDALPDADITDWVPSGSEEGDAV